MTYWRYRAYDADRVINSGVGQGRSFVELAFQLRQKGLFVIEATSISEQEVLSETKLEQWKKRVEGPDRPDVGKIHRKWSLTQWIFGRKN
jgi:type II secretory pathway component PulF